MLAFKIYDQESSLVNILPLMIFSLPHPHEEEEDAALL